MKINIDVMVEAILDSHNMERDERIVQSIAFWLECDGGDRISPIAAIINRVGPSDMMVRMRIIRAFAHIIAYS